ncbi:S16 family serine protease [Calothrix sp. CCY 0018]|uniref:S16 family serine protease n=1 Tax=Calothrix sp. CCY 0018 TaxID=3103864 RepID=UPI0039C653D6
MENFGRTRCISSFARSVNIQSAIRFFIRYPLNANRTDIKRVLLPTANQQNLVDIPEADRENIKFIFCDGIEKVLENALVE